jgi:hypothetical protein
MKTLAVSGLMVAFAVALGPALVGCGEPPPKTAQITAGEMPPGEEWKGVYYHPVYGKLHLIEEGTNVVGRWKRTDQSHWGELSGTVTGNVLRYTWKEHKVGMVGASMTTTGKGYFVYKVNGENIGELHGQFGLGQDEVGSDWRCVKQQREQPDLKSINGDTGGTAPPAAGKWD